MLEQRPTDHRRVSVALRLTGSGRAHPPQVGGYQLDRITALEHHCRVDNVLARRAQVNECARGGVDLRTQRPDQRNGERARPDSVALELLRLEILGLARGGDRLGGAAGDHASACLGAGKGGLERQHPRQVRLSRTHALHCRRAEHGGREPTQALTA